MEEFLVCLTGFVLGISVWIIILRKIVGEKRKGEINEPKRKVS